MIKTLVVYESKNGFTREVAKESAMVLANSVCYHVNNIQKDINNFEAIVICTPVYVYSGLLPESVLSFVNENLQVLKTKKVILICTCLDVNNGRKYLKPIKDIIDTNVVWQEVVGSNIELKQLDSEDYKNLKEYCEKNEVAFGDINLYCKDKFLDRMVKVRGMINEGKTSMPKEEGMPYVEKFLQNHNTCTLVTGHKNTFRATPIEYIYTNNCLYFISEGGEKFHNILLNPNVSIAVYDNFKSFNELGGMHIQGKATILEPTSDEYTSIIRKRGIGEELFEKLEISLYVIRVDIERVEFLWSGFKELGYDTKQVF